MWKERARDPQILFWISFLENNAFEKFRFLHGLFFRLLSPVMKYDPDMSYWFALGDEHKCSAECTVVQSVYFSTSGPD